MVEPNTGKSFERCSGRPIGRRQRRRNMIKGLHHNAYRCRDSEQTRRFYEDFLGLPLAGTPGDQRDEDRAPRPRCCTPSIASTTARTWRSSRRPTCPSSSSRSTTSTCTSRSRSSAPVLDEMLAKGKARGHRDPRHLRSRLHRLDLLPRSQRLRDRAERQASQPRRRHGPGHERRARHASPLDGRQVSGELAPRC